MFCVEQAMHSFFMCEFCFFPFSTNIRNRLVLLSFLFLMYPLNNALDCASAGCLRKCPNRNILLRALHVHLSNQFYRFPFIILQGNDTKDIFPSTECLLCQSPTRATNRNKKDSDKPQTDAACSLWYLCRCLVVWCSTSKHE